MVALGLYALTATPHLPDPLVQCAKVAEDPVPLSPRRREPIVQSLPFAHKHGQLSIQLSQSRLVLLDCPLALVALSRHLSQLSTEVTIASSRKKDALYLGKLLPLRPPLGMVPSLHFKERKVLLLRVVPAHRVGILHPDLLVPRSLISELIEGDLLAGQFEQPSEKTRRRLLDEAIRGSLGEREHAS
jgi:hypothetical protein